MSPRQIGLLGWAAIAVLVGTECERKPPRSLQTDLDSHEFWIRNFEQGLKDGMYDDTESQNVRRLIGDLRSASGPIPLRALGATAAIEAGQDQGVLCVLFYDERCRMERIRVTELNEAGQAILTEDYPIYPGGRGAGLWGDGILVPFRTRSHDEKKDEAAWREYEIRNVRDRRALPPLWISLPAEPPRVFISLIDPDGYQSEQIPLLVKRSETARTLARPRLAASAPESMEAEKGSTD